jgi:signal transduction histidine kinase
MARLTQRTLPVAVVLAGAALLVAVVALYTHTERQVIQRDNQQQLLLVQAVAHSLGGEIDDRLDSFETVARMAIPPGAELPTQLARKLEAAGFRQIHIREDERQHSPGLGVITGDVPLGERGMLLPVSAWLPGGRALEAVLPFEAFGPQLESWNRRVGGRLWLLDDDGRLIYSRLHPEMLGRSALGGERTCLACHNSFAMEAAMVKGAAGFEHHRVANRPEMLVCYAPVEFGGRRWSLAISNPQSEVTYLTRRGFLQASLLTALFLALVVTGAIGVIRFRAQKREAERRALIAENRARLEARMMRAEQLAAIGKMTAQIAHEINTPLASISLNVTYLLSEADRLLAGLPAELSDASEEIEREVERLKNFTGECLKLTHIHGPQFAPVSLAGVVRGFLSFIAREAKRRNIEIEARFESDPAMVRGDGDLLRQVLLNLTRNAFDAMPSGGRLEIALRENQGVAELRVSDSGPAVPLEQREKIFGAFFTTKAEGTGLGLAIARRIIEQHDGRIDCVSGEGFSLCHSDQAAQPEGCATGACFLVRLPLAADTAAEPSEDEGQRPVEVPSNA